MSERESRKSRPSFLWLLIGSAFLLLANGKWIVPVAAWLAPVFIVRFLRAQPLKIGLPSAYIAIFAVSIAQWKGMPPFPSVIYYQVMPLLAFGVFFAYLMDRLIAPRIGGFASTLVLPAAWVTIEYVLATTSAFGTWVFIAYTQSGSTPLLQVISVTGIYGVTFVMVWFAGIMNWSWERRFEWRDVRGGVLLYISVLAAVLIGGGIRLVFFPPQAETVRVASLIKEHPQFYPSSEARGRLFTTGELTESELEAIRATMSAHYERMFDRSRLEAWAGAKIIAWPEGGAWVLEEYEDEFLERAGQLAEQEGIYLVLGVATVHREPGSRPQGKPIENKVFIVDPSGEIVVEYLKSIPVLLAETRNIVRGPGIIPVLDTPYGRLGCSICFDLDFPSLLRQAGRAGVDIMLAPSNDWKEIDPLHAHMAAFRAIENGFSLVRPTSNGLSLATDHQGRTLASMDHFTTADRVMISHVPTKSVGTIYSRIGDVFAWICVAVFLALSVKALSNRKGT